MFQQSTLRTIREEKKRDVWSNRKRKAIVYSVWIAVFAVLISLSSRLNYLKLTTITTSGNEAVVNSEIQDFVFQLTKEKSSFFIQRNSLLFIPKKAIEEGLFQKYPRLKSIEISRDFPHTLTIRVTEHETDVVWCRNEYSKCFFIDREGVLLDQSPDFSGDAYFRIYDEDFSGITGEHILSLKDVANINLFRALLFKEVKLSAHSMAVSSDRTFAFFLNVPLRSLSDSPSLLVQNDFNAHAIVLNVLTIMNDPTFVASYSKHPENLDYIDLRFGNKVYYKFKK